jgi:acetyl esterase/lipase
VRSAISYLKENANAFKIDTNNFVLLGRSAGAQIALMAAYTFKESSIKGVIDFYGPAEMVWGYQNPASKWVMDSRGVMEDYLGGTYEQISPNYEKSSPINFVHRKTVPTLMLHGENDVLVSYLHSTKLQQKLRKNKVPHYLLSLPWATHGFDYSPNGPGGQLSAYAILHFLKSVFK